MGDGGVHLEDDGAVAVAEDRELYRLLDQPELALVKCILPHPVGAVVSWFRAFEVSRFRGSVVPGIRNFGVPGFQGFGVSGFWGSGVSGFRGVGVPGIQGSGVPDFFGHLSAT